MGKDKVSFSQTSMVLYLMLFYKNNFPTLLFKCTLLNYAKFVTQENKRKN